MPLSLKAIAMGAIVQTMISANEDPDEVELENNLKQDLGMDALDEIELVMRIEDALDIVLPEKESLNWTTVQDVVNSVDKYRSL